jgi:hypothetical protein
MIIRITVASGPCGPDRAGTHIRLLRPDCRIEGPARDERLGKFRPGGHLPTDGQVDRQEMRVRAIRGPAVRQRDRRGVSFQDAISLRDRAHPMQRSEASSRRQKPMHRLGDGGEVRMSGATDEAMSQPS